MYICKNLGGSMIKKITLLAICLLSFSVLAQNSKVLDGPFSFTLLDLDGESITFGYNQDEPNVGKISVLLIFSTWCYYCKQEIPQFQALWEKYKGHPEISLLALRTFTARETVSIEEFVDQYGITFPMVTDFPKQSPNYSATAKLWKLNYVPETFIYDRLGNRINFQLESTKDYYKVIDKLIQELL
jgi:peroxiredoxin